MTGLAVALTALIGVLEAATTGTGEGHGHPVAGNGRRTAGQPGKHRFRAAGGRAARGVDRQRRVPAQDRHRHLPRPALPRPGAGGKGRGRAVAGTCSGPPPQPRRPRSHSASPPPGVPDRVVRSRDRPLHRGHRHRLGAAGRHWSRRRIADPPPSRRDHRSCRLGARHRTGRRRDAHHRGTLPALHRSLHDGRGHQRWRHAPDPARSDRAALPSRDRRSHSRRRGGRRDGRVHRSPPDVT